VVRAATQIGAQGERNPLFERVGARGSSRDRVQDRVQNRVQSQAPARPVLCYGAILISKIWWTRGDSNP
jgi:hypothetical protein